MLRWPYDLEGQNALHPEWGGGREGVSDLLRYFAAFSGEAPLNSLRNLCILSLFSQKWEGKDFITPPFLAWMAGSLSRLAIRPLSPFRICMFIPSRAFAYLPLSPPPDRAVP